MPVYGKAVLDFSCIPWIDASAAVGISQLLTQVKELGEVNVYVAKCTSNVYDFEACWVCRILGKSNFSLTFIHR